MKMLMLSTVSGLSWNTIRKYAKSELLERLENDEPMYFHNARCKGFCDFACNGGHGCDIATDIGTFENFIPDDDSDLH